MFEALKVICTLGEDSNNLVCVPTLSLIPATLDKMKETCHNPAEVFQMSALKSQESSSCVQIGLLGDKKTFKESL